MVLIAAVLADQRAGRHIVVDDEDRDFVAHFDDGIADVVDGEAAGLVFEVGADEVEAVELAFFVLIGGFLRRRAAQRHGHPARGGLAGRDVVEGDRAVEPFLVVHLDAHQDALLVARAVVAHGDGELDRRILDDDSAVGPEVDNGQVIAGRYLVPALAARRGGIVQLDLHQSGLEMREQVAQGVLARVVPVGRPEVAHHVERQVQIAVLFKDRLGLLQARAASS